MSSQSGYSSRPSPLPDSSEPRFLLLEDDLTDIELVSAHLRRSFPSAQIDTVETEADFRAALQADPIDLILADHSLPSFDGLAALKIAQGTCPEVPVIIVSGVLGEERAINVLKQGATDYVLKQRLERLLPAVERALYEARSAQQRYQMELALRHSEARFYTSVEIMGDCFGIFTAARNAAGSITDFAISYLNRAACDYLSIDWEVQVRETLGAVMPLFKRSELFDLYCRVVETAQPLNQEVMLYGSPDADQYVAIDIRAVKLEDGLVVTWRDVTERRQFESERQRLLQQAEAAQAEAEAASQTKDEFLATLSHELRTPLNAIYGWTQLIQSRSIQESVRERALSIIRRNAELLSQMIEDVLDVSRIIRGRLRLELTPLSVDRVNEIVQAAIETVTPAAEAKGIAIAFTRSTASSTIRVDPQRLQQVAWNLLSNAIKFTPQSGQVAVTTATEQAFSLVVQDTGCGIAADLLPHVFERFCQANSSTARSQSGLGLGLAIVRHIIELHGGQVSASSPGAGQGAIFTVTLPLSQTAAVADGSRPAPSPDLDAADFEPDLSGLRILVVEDIEDARRLYTLMLETYGAEVTAVATAADALEALWQQQPHLLISDIGLPEVDGYALIRRVRALPADRGGQVPAIALTAYAGPKDRSTALLAGYQLHVPKPVDLQELAVVVAVMAQPFASAVVDS